MYFKNKGLCYYKQRNGYATLLSILFIGAISISIVVALLLFGIQSAKTGLVEVQSREALLLANACGEEGLQQIRDSTPFTGSATLTLGQGNCTYSVTSQGGHNRTVDASGTVGTVLRKVKIIVNHINPTIQIVSWQEIADF